MRVLLGFDNVPLHAVLREVESASFALNSERFIFYPSLAIAVLLWHVLNSTDKSVVWLPQTNYFTRDKP